MGWYGDVYLGDGSDFEDCDKTETVNCKAEIVTKPNGEKVIVVNLGGGDKNGSSE